MEMVFGQLVATAVAAANVLTEASIDLAGDGPSLTFDVQVLQRGRWVDLDDAQTWELVAAVRITDSDEGRSDECFTVGDIARVLDDCIDRH